MTGRGTPSSLLLLALLRRFMYSPSHGECGPGRGGDAVESDLGECSQGPSLRTSPMTDGQLGPKLTEGHEAPMLNWGVTAGAISPPGALSHLSPCFTLDGSPRRGVWS